MASCIGIQCLVITDWACTRDFQNPVNQYVNVCRCMPPCCFTLLFIRICMRMTWLMRQRHRVDAPRFCLRNIGEGILNLQPGEHETDNQRTLNSSFRMLRTFVSSSRDEVVAARPFRQRACSDLNDITVDIALIRLSKSTRHRISWQKFIPSRSGIMIKG